MKRLVILGIVVSLLGFVINPAIAFIWLWFYPAMISIYRSSVNAMKNENGEVTIKDFFSDDFKSLGWRPPIMIIVTGTIGGWFTLIIQAIMMIYSKIKDIKI